MDQSIVDKLCELMAPRFERYCVVSREAQEAFVRAVLKNGKIFDLARNKYDLAAQLDQNAIVNSFSTGVALQQKRKKINVGVSMTASDKAAVVAHNPDYQIEFENSQRINHSVAYVQRIIETKRCLAVCRHEYGHITDIGGNPHFHARAGHDNVHSCVLIDNMRDLGREKLRGLNAEDTGVTSRMRYCSDGVQNCSVDSVEAISMFAIQDIDPVDLVRGLTKKGVEFCTGVFHYDPMIYECERGYFPYFRMHFEKFFDASTNRRKIRFYFENDPSFDYVHDLETLLKYSRSWSYHVPSSDFVYRYDLAFVGDGIARFTIVRQNREYLGVATNEVAYRYVNHDSFYRINSWALDLTVDTMSPMTGFKPVTLEVPDDLFMFLYKFGMANDNSNPDKLFTVDQLRAQARTFNETRQINGYSFTGRLRMSLDDLEELVVAMYVIVMHDMVVEQCVATQQVSTMLSRQSAAKEKPFLLTTGKIVGFSFALPLIFAAGRLSDFATYIRLHMLKLAGAGSMNVSWEKLPSFVQLPSMQRYSGPGEPSSEVLTDHSFVPVDRTETFVRPQDVRDLFDDVLTDEQKDRLNKCLDKPYVREADVGVVQSADAETSRSLSPVSESFNSGQDEFDLSWYEQDIDDYMQLNREILWRRTDEHVQADTDDINSHSGPAILEHARYNFDVALAQVRAARDKCSEVYSGAPLANKITMYNNAEDAGIDFLRVQHGRIESAMQESYAFGIDPVSGKHFQIHSGESGAYIEDRTVTWLFVSRNTLILNGFDLGKRLLSIATKQKKETTEFHLVDAIYGAGKTYEIMQRFTEADIIVTQTSASKDDILASLSEEPRFKGVDLRRRVRTADSAVMHGLPKSNVVYIDEGLMMFPGQVYAIARLAKAVTAYVYGDTAQIPPIDRSTTLGFLTYQGMCRWNTIEFRNITYRSPADVVFVLLQYFKMERRPDLRTCSPVRRSLSLQTVKNPEDRTAYAVDVGWTFITILRVDRAALLVNPNMKDGKKFSAAQVAANQSRLLNVGEAQGSTFAKTKICRKFTYADELFKKPEQTVVAFSRHMLEAKYVTTVSDDPYANLVRKGIAATEAELDSVSSESPLWLRQKIANLKNR